jgi:hypothetical protein
VKLHQPKCKFSISAVAIKLLKLAPVMERKFQTQLIPKFEFINPSTNEIHYKTDLTLHNCSAPGCKQKYTFVFPYCKVHTRTLHSLCIKESRLECLRNNSVGNEGFPNLGLFAANPPTASNTNSNRAVFKQGETIAYYVGEIISQTESHRRYQIETKTVEHAPYAFAFTIPSEDDASEDDASEDDALDNESEILDGVRSRSIACFINHAPESEANVEAQPPVDFQTRKKIPLDKYVRVYKAAFTVGIPIVALRDIYEDEELLLNYGKKYAFDTQHKTYWFNQFNEVY